VTPSVHCVRAHSLIEALSGRKIPYPEIQIPELVTSVWLAILEHLECLTSRVLSVTQFAQAGSPAFLGNGRRRMTFNIEQAAALQPPNNNPPGWQIPAGLHETNIDQLVGSASRRIATVSFAGPGIIATTIPA